MASTRSEMARLLRLMRKELSEILRDRRTMLTLVLMPLLLYPLMSVAFRQFFLAVAVDAVDRPLFRLGFEDPREKNMFDGMRMFVEPRLIEYEDARGSFDPKTRPAIETHTVIDARAALENRDVDLIVRMPEVLGVRLNPLPRSYRLDCELWYLESSRQSVAALAHVQQMMLTQNAISMSNHHGHKPYIVEIRTRTRSFHDSQTSPAFSLAALVPLILILMTITGAVYPAIDLTAGERERGTLEILVAAPVSRLGLLFAKYIAVLTVAVLTALINLTSMMVTLLLSELGPMIFGSEGVTLLLMVQILGLLLLFAAFFSALLLTITSFARSFKEGQAFLIPLILVSLAPGLASLLPGTELTPVTSVVPLLNIVLLGRDLLQGTAAPALAGVVVLTTLLYAGAAIALAARVFGAENVLYSDESGWGEFLRRPLEPAPAPTLANALLCLALTLPLSYALQGGLSRLATPGFSVVLLLQLQLAAQVVGSAAFFCGLPLLLGWWRRVELQQGFQLARPGWLGLLGALLLGLSLWPWVLELLAVFHQLGLTSRRSTQEQQLIADAIQRFRERMPLPVMAAAFALTAACEELFFRGYLFSALRRVTTPRLTIVLTALLFGLFHLVVTDRFQLERLLPSTLMGLILSIVCWRTGSVWPPLVLHAGYNAALQAVLYLQPGEEAAELLPWTWLVAAALGCAVGTALLLRERAAPRA